MLTNKNNLFGAKKRKCGNLIGTMLLVPVLLAGCAASGQYLDDQYSMAKKAYEDQDYATSVKSFNQYMADHPNSLMTEMVLYYLAKSYKGLGDNQKSIETYQKLIDQYKTGSWVDWAKQDLAKMQ